jgi:uncharacterized protein (TIGR02284 family)
MKKPEEISSKVNHLVEICNERKSGYEKAAENIKDPGLTTLFTNYAIQSKDFANELVEFSNLKDPEDIGTRTISNLFRGWMDLKAAVTQGDPDAMISACAQGEKQMIDDYEDCLKDDLPLELKRKIEKQLQEIKTAYRHIKSKES